MGAFIFAVLFIVFFVQITRVITGSGTLIFSIIFQNPKISFIVLSIGAVGFALGNIFSIYLALYCAVVFGMGTLLYLLQDVLLAKDFFLLKMIYFGIITTGVGFILGNIFSFGWAIFGAFMGLLLSVAVYKEQI